MLKIWSKKSFHSEADEVKSSFILKQDGVEVQDKNKTIMIIL